MKSPSNWINLQDYLGVNEEMGKEMAGVVARQVGTQAAGAQNQLRDGQAAFDAQATAGANPYEPNSGADATARAQQGYTGPSSLGDVDPNLESSVSDAARRVRAAGTSSGQETELGQAYRGKTASGGLDSFLLSGAGGGAMAELQSTYGSIEKDGYDANEASIKTGEAIKKQTADNQAQWGNLAETQKSAAEATAARAAQKAELAAIEKMWGETNKNNWGQGVLGGVSLGGQIYGATQGGKKDPVEEWMQKTFQGGKNYGNILWQDHPNDRAVFGQMDAEQWNELTGLRSDSQKRWIQNRAEELRTGSGRKKGKFVDWRTM